MGSERGSCDDPLNRASRLVFGPQSVQFLPASVSCSILACRPKGRKKLGEGKIFLAAVSPSRQLPVTFHHIVLFVPYNSYQKKAGLGKSGDFLEAWASGYLPGWGLRERLLPGIGLPHGRAPCACLRGGLGRKFRAKRWSLDWRRGRLGNVTHSLSTHTRPTPTILAALFKSLMGQLLC